MFRLKLFGVPTLERDGVGFTGRATQRHRLALLALLATAPGQRLSRDKLLGLLWPESDAERGRNLLKTATYVIRTELGEQALLTAGDELRLNADLVESDVGRFEAALELADPERAIGWYAGPFLDGFFLSDAVEFERWVDSERTRLAGLYHGALEALAAAASRAGDHAAAAEWWKQRAAQDPYDSRVALGLMSALEASGNRAGALQHAAIHQRLLQEEFGVTPPAEVNTLVERLRQLPAPAAPARVPATATVVGQQLGNQAEPTRGVVPRRPTSRLLSAAVAVLALIAASTVWAVWPRSTTAAASIVVLPFVNYSGDEENEYFSDGLTEEIITRLAAVPGLKVISRTSAMHYKGSNKPLPEIARELHVDHILEGSVRREAGKVRVSAQLIDARADGHLWANNFEHRLSDSFRVQEEIAREVASALELRIARDTRRLLSKQGTRDAEAYQLYQRARFLWNSRTRDGHERAIEYFNRAIARDSSYADAYAGLAHAYLTGYMLNLLPVPDSVSYNRLQSAAERALALDEESAEAHVAAAVAHMWRHDWPAAERAYRRALELNPGHAIAHSWYSLLLRGMSRGEEALRESRRAAELDPFGVVISHNYAWQYYLARDYGRALAQFRSTLELATYPSARRYLAFVHLEQGNAAEALAHARRALEIAPERPEFAADLAYVHARTGQPDSARAWLRRAKQQPLEPFNIGRAHVALNEADSALVWLARSNWHWPNRTPRDDPALDPIRDDPRFGELLQRVDRELGMR